ARDEIVNGVKAAIAMAKAIDPQGLMRRLQRELGEAQGELKQRRTPEQQLPFWLALLEARERKDVNDAAAQDAELVLAHKDAPAADRARARAVQGLVLRNREKFAEAKAALTEAKAALGGDGAFAEATEVALREVADPAGTYAP